MPEGGGVKFTGTLAPPLLVTLGLLGVMALANWIASEPIGFFDFG